MIRGTEEFINKEKQWGRVKAVIGWGQGSLYVCDTSSWQEGYSSLVQRAKADRIDRVQLGEALLGREEASIRARLLLPDGEVSLGHRGGEGGHLEREVGH